MPTSFTFSNDRALIDRDLVHRWLSEESYWAKAVSYTHLTLPTKA